MKKNIISVVLVMALVVSLFTGCGSKEEVTTEVAGGETKTETTEAAETTETAETEEVVEEQGPPTQLKLSMFAAGDAKDLKEVNEEINKILREKINAEVLIELINFGAYRQQTNLVLSSGEPLDLMATLFTPTLASYVSNGMFLPLDDLLATKGTGILDIVPESALLCGNINGETYGVPNFKEWAANYGFAYRKDLGEKHGIDPAQIKTLEDVEAVLRIIKANEPDIIPLAPQNGNMLVTNWYQFDNLGDGNALGTLPNGADELKVINYYDSDEFESFANMTRKWYVDGLIMTDILNNTETSSSLVKNGRAFGYLSNTKPGFAAQESRATGMEMVVVELTEAYTTTSGIQNIVWAIPANSENPEKAMELMNLMYTDADISNLMIYGIEGKHYKFVDEANGIIGYADGVDPTNNGYPGGTGWGWANQFIAHVWNGNPADYWEQYLKFNEGAKKSAALGFVFNADNVATEMAACVNVIEQYYRPLMAGVIDPAEVLAKFNQELMDAGLDKIMAEKQKQLDEWAAANKK